MADIYILKIMQFPHDRTYENTDLISSERKRKIHRYKFIEDSYRSMIAALLVRYAVINKTGYKNDELIFCTSEYGKPYLKEPNIQPLHFNFSHSGEYVVCAIDDEECGVDVEDMSNYSEDIADNAFHENEVTKLHQYDDNKEAARYFTFLWTMKEAYLKALGVGLSKPLSSFCILEDNNKISITDFEINSRKFSVFESRNIEYEYVVSYVGNNNPTYHYISDIELMEYVKKWSH